MVPAEPDECPFEYQPFEELYSQALRHVVDRRLKPGERRATARALAFLLRERVVTERVATDVLAAIHGSLDVAKVVRTLLLGLRDTLGDHERIAEWTRRIVGRAHEWRHVETFVSVTRILVGLRDFDGAVTTSWQLSLIRASEDPRLQRRVRSLADDYARRFGSEPRWVKTVRARFILEAPSKPTAGSRVEE